MRNTILVAGIMILGMNGALARNSLIRSLERNLALAEETKAQEKGRYQRAKLAYNASKDTVRSAKAVLAKAIKDDEKQQEQIKAIAEANAEFYEIPNYRYDGDSTEIRYGTKSSNVGLREYQSINK
jgi:hypothetical protein